MRQVTLASDPTIELTLKKSHRARRISLRVSSLDGRITLTHPARVAADEALAFAESKREWIATHLADQQQPIRVDMGSILPIAGKDTCIVAGTGRRVRLEGGSLLVPGARDMVPSRVKAFLKLEAKTRLTDHAERYAERLGRPINRITLKDTRSRWGSCSSRGNLMFSWRLILTPPEVLDYVAAHEAAHLVEMNHSHAFWTLVDQICPEYRPARDWLRENGAALHRFRFAD